MSDESYKKAFDAAVEELAKVMERREELEDELEKVNERVKTLTRSIHGLGGLIHRFAVVDLIKERPELFPEFVDKQDIGFTDAVRNVLKSNRVAFTPMEVRDELRREGFDISKYKNVLASIHAILKRLVSQGQAETIEEDGKLKYAWIRDRDIGTISYEDALEAVRKSLK